MRVTPAGRAKHSCWAAPVSCATARRRHSSSLVAILGAALKAADQLAAAGLACRVLSVHSIRPLDHEAILRAARETGGIVTVEEHVVEGGLGGAVAECCLEGGVAVKGFRRIGLRGGAFASAVGSQEFLRTAYGMDTAAIEAAVRAIVG